MKFMRQKRLIKKIRRLEARLQKGATKLANLKQKLRAVEAAKLAKAKKERRHITPERRAQLSAAMKARWAAKRAAVATPEPSSEEHTATPEESSPQ
jgi:hypothetical protein